jgi:hypothetical protein
MVVYEHKCGYEKCNKKALMSFKKDGRYMCYIHSILRARLLKHGTDFECFRISKEQKQIDLESD